MVTGNLSGKNVLITGGTNGIGKGTALQFARLGATVTIVGQNADRGKAAKEDIKIATGNQRVQFIQADFSLLGDVRRVVHEVNQITDQLDYLVQCAGTTNTQVSQTPEGLYPAMVINYLSKFYITNALLPLLRKTHDHAGVLLVTATGTDKAIDYAVLEGKPLDEPVSMRRQSQMTTSLFAIQCAHELAGSPVSIKVENPGFVKGTNVTNGMPPALRTMIKVLGLFMGSTPEQAGDVNVQLVTDPHADAIFYSQGNPMKSPPVQYDDATLQKLWETSRLVTGL